MWILRFRKWMVRHNVEEKVIFVSASALFGGYIAAEYYMAAGYDFREALEKDREENPILGRRQFPGESDEEYERNKGWFQKVLEKYYK